MAYRLVAALPALSALVGSALAQTSVVSIFIPDTDDQALVGSVVSVSGSTTVMAIACPSGTADEDCGFSDGITITEAPNTFAATLVYPGVETVQVECGIDNDVAVCTASATIPSASTATSIVSSYSVNDNKIAVTVTAGADKLSAGASGSPSTASSTGSATQTGTLTTVTSSATKSGSSSTPSSASSSPSTAGMPRITQNAILAGAAMVVGGAAMIL